MKLDFNAFQQLNPAFKELNLIRKTNFEEFQRKGLPSKKQEKIYRLYCDKVAKNGKKIPYLSKNLIFKLSKSLGEMNRVSCYIEYNDNEKIIPIFLVFDNYSNIYIKTEFKETKSIPEIENIITNAVNPILEIVKKYIENSGYSMNLFNNNLYDKNIIKQIH